MPKKLDYKADDFLQLEIRKNTSLDDISIGRHYSIDELSNLIVNLEKKQADIKEKLLVSNESDKKSLRPEISFHEMKLKEIRDLQNTMLASKDKII